MNQILNLHNQIENLYKEYNALVLSTFPLGSVVKDHRALGIVIYNEGRFGLTIINDNGHTDAVMPENAVKVNIKDIPSNTRRRLIEFKKYGIRAFWDHTKHLGW